MARKKKKDDGGGGAYWMDTYGDLVTNLLCFFVLLYAFSSVDEAKWEALVVSFGQMPTVVIETLDAEQEIEEAQQRLREDAYEQMQVMKENMVSSGDMTGSLPNDIPSNTDFDFSGIGENSEIKQKFEDLYRRMRTYVTENELTSSLDLIKEDDQILLRFKDNLLFDTGKADLKPEAYPILDEVLSMIEEFHKAIEKVLVEGHTDNVPIKNANYVDNLALSQDRAHRVGKYLIDKQPPPQNIFGLMGYGDQRPIATNETEEGRAKNRRVEIIVERAKLTIPLGDSAMGGLSSTASTVLEETD